MGISIHNYEQYFLDHLEGNLSPEMERELSDFLAAHPELRPILEDLDLSPIPAGAPVEFHPKESLKKNIHPTAHIHAGNAEEMMVSSLEGLLDPKLESELEEFVRRNPLYRRDWLAFGKTKLLVDASITFPGKQQLKKTAPVFTLGRIVWASAAIAAMIVLFLGIRYFISPVEIKVVQNPVQVASKSGIDHLGTSPDPLEVPRALEKPSGSTGKESNIEPVRRTALIDSMQMRHTPYRLSNTYSAGPIPAERKIIAQAKTKKIKKSTPIVAPGNKSIIAKVTDNLFARAETNIRENTRLDDIGKKRFSFWGLLDSGIKGYNTITDRDIELYVRRDEDGKVESYTLVENSRLITTRDLNKN